MSEVGPPTGNPGSATEHVLYITNKIFKSAPQIFLMKFAQDQLIYKPFCPKTTCFSMKIYNLQLTAESNSIHFMRIPATYCISNPPVSNFRIVKPLHQIHVSSLTPMLMCGTATGFATVNIYCLGSGFL